jgi:hypothetical protein
MVEERGVRGIPTKLSQWLVINTQNGRSRGGWPESGDAI